jgi:hypothetical protein
VINLQHVKHWLGIAQKDGELRCKRMTKRPNFLSEDEIVAGLWIRNHYKRCAEKVATETSMVRFSRTFAFKPHSELSPSSESAFSIIKALDAKFKIAPVITMTA